MFASPAAPVTVAGLIALLKVIDTVRPLTLVAVIVGEVVSARVNVIDPLATRLLPSSDSTVSLAGLWIEKV